MIVAQVILELRVGPNDRKLINFGGIELIKRVSVPNVGHSMLQRGGNSGVVRVSGPVECGIAGTRIMSVVGIPLSGIGPVIDDELAGINQIGLVLMIGLG